MSAAVLNKKVDEITDDIISPGKENKASTWVKVICLTTDKKSLKNSKKLVEFLEQIIESKLPNKEEGLKLDIVNENYTSINDNLKKINALLDIVKKIFDSGKEVEMDEEIMIDFLANMQKAQHLLTHISDYLELVLQVQKEKNSTKKESSFGDLINLIKAA